jgi:hypothetical protein
MVQTTSFLLNKDTFLKEEGNEIKGEKCLYYRLCPGDR